MKNIVLSILLASLVLLPANAQYSDSEQLQGYISDGHNHCEGHSEASIPGPGAPQLRVLTPAVDYSSTETASSNLYSYQPPQQPEKPSKLKRFGVGLGKLLKNTGIIAGEVAVATLEAAAYASANANAYSYAGGDACVHGYTYQACPYGYNGNSYGTPYLSGPSPVRMRRAMMGSYRFYTTDGSYGSLTPNYVGGYNVRVSSRY